MTSTDKEQCVLLATILHEHGCRNVVLCPGSRNLPLIRAFVDCGLYRCHSVVDEREAAFFALGIAEIAGEPVAVVCTSGSAVLNIAPAVAEARYKHIPLIVISADRPLQWIDQQDSQTIRQPGVLKPIVKSSYNLPDNGLESTAYWSREINDAALSAVTSPKGPVHINVPLDVPLGRLKEYCDLHLGKVIQMPAILSSIEKSSLTEMAKRIQLTPKILLIASGLAPSRKLSRQISKLMGLDNIAVLSESLANIHGSYYIPCSDSLIKSLSPELRNDYVPDLLITFGDPIVSSEMKKWLRENRARTEHWHINPEENLIDTFGCLLHKIPMEPEDFFAQIIQELRISHGSIESDYRENWTTHAKALEDCQRDFLIKSTQWSDITALFRILTKINRKANLQFSNGMAVRYQLNIPGMQSFHRIDSNRGVSGIDGCTSTALGAAAAYTGPTFLVSGDMSARYDISGFLDAARLTRGFRMLIFDNGGGNIFKVISKDAEDEVRDLYAVGNLKTDWKGLAMASGWNYSECGDFSTLETAVDRWLASSEKPSLLVIKTLADNNVVVYRNYINLKIKNEELGKYTGL